MNRDLSADTTPSIAVLGAGIGGLSTAYFLRQHGIRPLVLEKGTTYGGLARSFRWNGVWCDFSAHRFFTQDEDLLATVQRLTPMHRHERRSQIFLHDTWMNDPIDLIELATHLPPTRTAALIGGYLARPRSLPEASFEHYVLRHFGQPLYESFFRAYTERLFSLPGDEIAVEWARRKVRLASPFDRFKQATKTKFSAFHYPVRGGYGAIAQALYEAVQDDVQFDARVTGLERESDGRITAVRYDQAGEPKQVAVDAVISTLPLTLNARFMDINIDLDFQKVDAVYLHLNKPEMTPNHWLYFMDRESTINRLVEFKQMSAVETDPQTTVVCAEVTKEVDEPITAVIDNLVRTRSITRADVLDAQVIREPFAYPRYRTGYPQRLQPFRQALEQHPNLHVYGRAAQFEHLEVDDIIGAAHTMVKDVLKPTPYGVSDAVRDAAEPPQVWIVVLAWNNYEDTAECLESIQNLTYPHRKIVLVDNGSTDNTPERVRTAFPKVTVLENGANIGVPAGYNVGFHHAMQQGAEYVLMLNNDTTVDPEMLQGLLAAAQEPDAGILVPIVYYTKDPDQVWSSGARYRRFPPAIVMERRIFQPTSGYHDLEYAISCGLLITRRAFKQVGLFDENFRFLWDDLDFSERVRRSGLRILQVPSAKMWHKVSRSTQPGSALFWQVHGESGAIFYRRHGRFTALEMAIHLGYFALREFVWKWRLRSLRPFLRGLRHGITNPLRDVPRVKDELPYPG